MEENREGVSENRPKSNNWIIFASIAVALVLLGGALFLVKSKSSQTNPQSGVVEEKTQESFSPTAISTEDGKSASAEVTEVTVEGGNFYFKPNEIRVREGQKVILTFKNAGGTHNLVIDELGVRTKTTTSGEGDTIEFIANKKGTFEFYCSIDNHKAMGMRGSLIVE